MGHHSQLCIDLQPIRFCSNQCIDSRIFSDLILFYFVRCFYKGHLCKYEEVHVDISNTLEEVYLYTKGLSLNQVTISCFLKKDTILSTSILPHTIQICLNLHCTVVPRECGIEYSQRAECLSDNSTEEQCTAQSCCYDIRYSPHCYQVDPLGELKLRKGEKQIYHSPFHIFNAFISFLNTRIQKASR